jgi:hypothetical protein
MGYRVREGECTYRCRYLWFNVGMEECRHNRAGMEVEENRHLQMHLIIGDCAICEMCARTRLRSSHRGVLKVQIPYLRIMTTHSETRETRHSTKFHYLPPPNRFTTALDVSSIRLLKPHYLIGPSPRRILDRIHVAARHRLRF